MILTQAKVAGLKARIDLGEPLESQDQAALVVDLEAIHERLMTAMHLYDTGYPGEFRRELAQLLVAWKGLPHG